jgi:hypothetical protein
MTIDERARHQMYLKLEEILGPDEATTLMEHLPPLGWADVATKRDLDQFAASLRGELRDGVKDLELRIERELRSLAFKVLASMAAVAGIALAIARLT